MKKRLLTVILSLLFVLPLLAACGDNSGGGTTTQAVVTADPSATTADSNLDDKGYLLDDLPDNLNFGVTVTTLMWNDYTMREFYAEETGDIIDDAIYLRNTHVEDRLGVTLEYVETPGDSTDMSAYIAKAEADFKSGDAVYDIYAAYSRVPPSLSLKGYTEDLLATQYFDVEKPWWPDALTNECTINNHLFFCSGDISTNLLWMMIATFYNKTLYETMQYEKTPYELIESNEWTMSKLIEMTKDVYTDVNNSGSKDAADSYGYIIYEVNIDAFQTAAGITSVAKTSGDELAISEAFSGERAANVCQLIGDFLGTQGVYHTSSVSLRSIFYEERSLFIMDRVFIAAGKDNAADQTKIDFSYGVVPNPKYDSAQENFSTNVGHPFTMYAISANSKNIDCVSATLECLGSESYRLVTPAVFETAMKFKYTDDPVAAEMYDIIRDNISFDIGRLYAGTFSNATANLFRTTALSSPSSYTTAVQRYTKSIFPKAVTQIMEMFK